jgi:hypothetical protein
MSKVCSESTNSKKRKKLMISDYEHNMSSAIPWSVILGSEENHDVLLKTHFKESLNKTTQHLGVSFSGLKRKLAIEGIAFPIKEGVTQKIKNLSVPIDNMTSTEIGEMIGYSTEAVASACRRNKISYKKRNGLQNLSGVQ